VSLVPENRIHAGRVILYAACAVIFLYLILPIFVIIPISFSESRFLRFPPEGFSLQWYEEFFQGRNWMSATLRSFQVAILTTILATILGTLASLALVRGDFPAKRLLYALIISPIIIPVIVTAVAVYYIFAGFRMIGTIWALVLAHTVLALPFVVVNVTATLQGFDLTLERAALSLGANRLIVFTRIILPLSWPGIFSGALFAFITSFDEVVVAIFLTGARPTLPKQMWDGIRVAINPTISAVASLLIVFSVVLLLALQIFSGRSARRRGAGR
jgi:putative spermidine/putrescine transport system permease protein